MAAPSVNLLAWLRPERIHVAFAGAAWQMHASSAADWLGAISYDFDTLSGVFPGLVHDDELDAMYDLITDPSQLDSMPQVARNVVQAAGGRDWWWSVNLTRKALGGWIYFNGFLVRQGVRADSTSFPDWMDACYTFLWERTDENGRMALDLELGLPPRGVKLAATQTKQMLSDFAAD